MRILSFLFVALFTTSLVAQEVVLVGTPAKLVELDQFGDRATYNDFLKVNLRITRDGEQYYWASRGDIPLARKEDGIYVTYVALDGSGYIQTVNETARERFLSAAPDNIVGRYTYVEHLLNHMMSTTIYGR